MRVEIRADASLPSGTGHVMRCWAIAESLQALGVNVVWTSEISVKWLAQAMKHAGWSVEPPAGDWDRQASTPRGDVVLVDSYTAPSEYRESLMRRGVPVVAVIDSFHQQAGLASLWVNPGPPRDFPEIDEARYLNGLDYILIRSELRELKNSSRVAQGHGPQLAIVLGGAGHGALRQMIDSPPPLFDESWTIWAGPGEASRSSRVHWLPAGSELMEIAASSTLVASSSGVSSWEFVYLQVPLALMMTARNQEGNFEAITSRGWGYPLGAAENVTSDATLWPKLIAAHDHWARGSLETTSVIDGLGADRVAKRIVDLGRTPH